MALGACGGSDEDADAKAALVKTVSATSKIQSGRLTASFGLDPEGLAALGGPITARASGPFAAPAAGELPTSKLALSGKLGSTNLSATATTTGKQAFLRLEGKDYKLDGDTVKALTGALGKDSGAGFATLGLDPTSWITDAKSQDDTKVGDVDTTHVSGKIDAGKLLADIGKLLDGTGLDGLLTEKLRKQIADGVKSSKVDVYSGADDQILRRLVLAMEFAFDTGDSPITGLDGGKITLDLRIDDVDETTVDVTAPKNARPISELPDGAGLGQLLDGLGGTLPGGEGESGDKKSGSQDDRSASPDKQRTSEDKDGATGGADSKAFLNCIKTAGTNADKVADCAKELAP